MQTDTDPCQPHLILMLRTQHTPTDEKIGMAKERMQLHTEARRTCSVTQKKL